MGIEQRDITPACRYERIMGQFCSKSAVSDVDPSRPSGIDFSAADNEDKEHANQAVAERRPTKGAGLLGKTDWSDEEDEEEESADQPAEPKEPEESQVQDEQSPKPDTDEPVVENENAEEAPTAEGAPIQQESIEKSAEEAQSECEKPLAPEEASLNEEGDREKTIDI